MLFRIRINGRSHRRSYIIFQDARRNAETLRSFICRTKISACACPQDFCILFPILRWEIHLLPGWDFETSRNAFVLQKKTLQDEEVMASCVFAGYLATVLMHLPADGLPPLKDFLPYLPAGIRAYAIYILAHNAYLNEEYERALGLCQSVFLMLDGCYPIAMEYLYCVIIMCLNNQKKHEEASEILLKAWNMAKPDGFLEPFIEHHGLMLGQIEACIKPTEPENYKRLSQAVIAFSRGWMDIHNPQLQSSVTDKLTPMEFSIAMLASKGWTNREIADHLSMSVNTIKHYLSRIFQTLGVEKREELKPFVNK